MVVDLDLLRHHGNLHNFFVRKHIEEPANAAGDARIAPKTVSEELVMSPPNSSMMPKASTMGHAVGAGSITAEGVALLWPDFDLAKTFRSSL